MSELIVRKSLFRLHLRSQEINTESETGLKDIEQSTLTLANVTQTTLICA